MTPNFSEPTLFSPATASMAGWAEFHTYRSQRWKEDAIGEPLSSNAEIETNLITEWPLSQFSMWLVKLDGAVVASLEVTIRRPNTEHFEEHKEHVEAWIAVLGFAQRNGLGTRLLATLADFMTAHQKSILSLNARTPAGNAFLTAVGAQMKFSNTRNRLDMSTVNWRELESWRVSVEKQFPQFTWEIYAGKVPFTRLEHLYDPLNELLSQVPTDSLEQAPMRFEDPAMRAWYKEIDEYGGKHLLVMLKDGSLPSARIIAVSSGGFDERRPEWIHQALTAVVADMRGKGIAKAIKSKMTELMREHQPNAKWIGTYNAKSNAPILAVNRRMGFTTMREIATYQIRLNELNQYISSRSGD
jgi:GNAT superfamily N-acetyltransferase